MLSFKLGRGINAAVPVAQIRPSFFGRSSNGKLRYHAGTDPPETRLNFLPALRCDSESLSRRCFLLSLMEAERRFPRADLPSLFGTEQENGRIKLFFPFFFPFLSTLHQPAFCFFAPAASEGFCLALRWRKPESSGTCLALLTYLPVSRRSWDLLATSSLLRGRLNSLLVLDSRLLPN